jgi:hypothetical protein
MNTAITLTAIALLAFLLLLVVCAVLEEWMNR